MRSAPRRLLPLPSRLALAVLLVAASSILLVGAPARATLISQDWKTPGDGLLTLDTQTGYKWLDLTVTVGKLPSQVCQPQAYCMNNQFELATLPDVITFWSHAGVYPTGVPLRSMAQSVSFLQSLVGVTRTNLSGEALSQGIYFGPYFLYNLGGNDTVGTGIVDYGCGYLCDTATLSLQPQVRFSFRHGFKTTLLGQAGFSECSSLLTLSCDVEGIWLVQKQDLVHICPLSTSGCGTPLPEPGPAWLLGAAVLALGGRRRLPALRGLLRARSGASRSRGSGPSRPPRGS